MNLRRFSFLGVECFLQDVQVEILEFSQRRGLLVIRPDIKIVTQRTNVVALSESLISPHFRNYVDYFANMRILYKCCFSGWLTNLIVSLSRVIKVSSFRVIKAS